MTNKKKGAAPYNPPKGGCRVAETSTQHPPLGDYRGPWHEMLKNHVKITFCPLSFFCLEKLQ